MADGPYGEYIANELKTATFDPKDITYLLFGGEEGFKAQQQWEKGLAQLEVMDLEKDVLLSREEKLKRETLRALETVKFMKKNKDLLAAHSPVHGEGGLGVSRLTGNHSGITDHFALYVVTIMAQGTPEQQRTWLPKALSLETIGTYAQTELGHGSNVRGLETTATFDQATDSFVIDMPKITAMKWWPGALGLLATHAIVYARLIVKDKDLGYHAFMIQIRDENHRPMPGVEVGDVGPKMGVNGLDSGYLYIKKVRVPRFNMLAKFQSLDKDGNYTGVPRQLGKIAYATMMKSRVVITLGSGYQLARNLCIAVRYNAFRKQGFVDGKKGLAGGEHTILDYTIQQSRLLPLIATCYGCVFAAKRLSDLLKVFDTKVKAAGKDINSIDTSFLPELHATSAGLKSFCTEMAAHGIEEARKCCGGHGYALYSGIAIHGLDFLPSITYEGDRFPMALQTARALVGTVMGRVKPQGSTAYLGLDDDVQLTDCASLDNITKYWATIARRSVVRAGEALGEAAGNDMKPDQAWNACHVVLMQAAYCHTIYSIMTAYHDFIPQLPKGPQPAFTRLAQLFGLSKLVDLSVAASHLTPEVAEKVDARILELYRELRPDAMAFVEAWAIPDRVLASCIARRDGKIYEAIVDFTQKNPINRKEYVDSIRRELDPFLGKEYLKKGAAAQSKI